MLRIGDAAKQYNISNRTLRYWEEKGILTSIRAENGYRYYDQANTMRIRQIHLLRRLEMPLAHIEQIFISNNMDMAIKGLNSHLETLQNRSAVSHSLAIVVEALLQRMQTCRSLEQMFSYLEAANTAVAPVYTEPPQIKLSERDFIMRTNQLDNVRIVRLPAMTVASYRAQSATPEEDCSKVFNRFVLENNLHKRSAFRQFGFNNPSPAQGNPVYGYEMWVTIPEGCDVPPPLVKKQFGGGLYASISTRMNEIGERWRLLNNWCENSEKYDVDVSIQWLEECTMDFETFISGQVDDGEKQLDLLEPVQPR